MSEMTYTLHAAPGSCSFAPHIVLEDIGAPYELALMSPGHPEALTEAFRQINPKGRIPVLCAENLVLTEAPAILLFLGAMHPEADLLDPQPMTMARSVEWFNWLSGGVHAVAVRMIWRPDTFSDDGAGHERVMAKGRAHLDTAFAMIEDKLTDRTWAVGETYSVVDPYLLVFYRWGNRMHIDMMSKYPAWTTHARRLEQRPSVQSALAQEGISLWA